MNTHLLQQPVRNRKTITQTKQNKAKCIFKCTYVDKADQFFRLIDIIFVSFIELGRREVYEVLRSSVWVPPLPRTFTRAASHDHLHHLPPRVHHSCSLLIQYFSIASVFLSTLASCLSHWAALQTVWTTGEHYIYTTITTQERWLYH